MLSGRLQLGGVWFWWVPDDVPGDDENVWISSGNSAQRTQHNPHNNHPVQLGAQIISVLRADLLLVELGASPICAKFPLSQMDIRAISSAETETAPLT